MKRIFTTTMLIISLAMQINLECMAYDWTVRPVKIKVVDAVTKQPLSGIKVYYVLTTRRPAMGCFYIFYPSFIHPPNMISERPEAIEKTTDNNGEIHFVSKKLNFRCYEGVSSEKIAFNLDVDDLLPRFKWLYEDRSKYIGNWVYVAGDDEFQNVNPDYKGFFLTYVYKSSDHEQQMATDKDYRNVYEMHRLKKLDDLQIATVWKGPPEEYTVELRRAEK